MEAKHRVVIVGGGFGGLYTAQALRKAPVEVTLIDRRNFHLFQPLLYQVATGGLSPANIASPLRALLSRQRNARVLLAEVVGFDLERRRSAARGRRRRRLRLADRGGRRPASLLQPSGMGERRARPQDDRGRHRDPPPHPVRLRGGRAQRPTRRTQDVWLTFVVVGAGPTGVELAGAVAEIAHRTLRDDFRAIQPSRTRIILLEGADRVLGTYAPSLSRKAAAALARLGVTVRTGAIVTDVKPDQVTSGAATAPRSSRRGRCCGRPASMRRRWPECWPRRPAPNWTAPAAWSWQPDLTLPGRPEVFVIGDMANYPHQTGKPLPGVAQVAMQQGRYVAGLIQRRLRGEPPPRFHYHDRGTMATIGANSAVADLGWARFNGYLAWLAWLFIHIVFLVEFENRLLVLVQWAWNYFTRNRSARLITGPPPDQEADKPTRRAEEES